jgi:hypothetical protein
MSQRNSPTGLPSTAQLIGQAAAQRAGNRLLKVAASPQHMRNVMGQIAPLDGRGSTQFTRTTLDAIAIRIAAFRLPARYCEVDPALYIVASTGKQYAAMGEYVHRVIIKPAILLSIRTTFTNAGYFNALRGNDLDRAHNAFLSAYAISTSSSHRGNRPMVRTPSIDTLLRIASAMTVVTGWNTAALAA